LTHRRLASNLFPVLFRLAQGILVLALILSIGAHWAVLQSAAWAGMIYNYSQQTTLSRAVTLTFSGDKPCSLCKVVEQGKAQEREREQEVVQSLKDIKLALCLEALTLRAPRVERFAPTLGDLRSIPPHAPDAPPPRTTLA
jgi:hypothetical protein